MPQLSGQRTRHLADAQLHLPRLSARFEEPFHRVARGGFADQLLEEIGFLRQPLRQRQRARIDRAFGETHGGRRERRDAVRERVDIRTDLVRFERAVEIAPAFRGAGSPSANKRHQYCCCCYAPVYS